MTAPTGQLLTALSLLVTTIRPRGLVGEVITDVRLVTARTGGTLIPATFAKDGRVGMENVMAMKKLMHRIKREKPMPRDCRPSDEDRWILHSWQSH